MLQMPIDMKPRWLTFDCFILRQGSKGPEIALFPIDAYALQDLATVSRIADERRGYQRIINPRKLAAIRRYVEIPEAVLPTGIVLASGERPGIIKKTRPGTSRRNREDVDRKTESQAQR